MQCRVSYYLILFSLSKNCVSTAPIVPHLPLVRYLGYRKDNKIDGLPSGQELFISLVCFLQFLLLGTFAAILAAHRSEIIDKENESLDVATYETPYTAASDTNE